MPYRDRTHRRRARVLRKGLTDAERVLWTRLRRRRLGGFRFRRQHPVGPYIVDFACPQLRLAIEVDGSQHDADRAKDERRTEELLKSGYRVLRFWNSEVLDEVDGVSGAILRTAARLEKRWG